jgi:hypothetical protein
MINDELERIHKEDAITSFMKKIYVRVRMYKLGQFFLQIISEVVFACFVLYS